MITPKITTGLSVEFGALLQAERERRGISRRALAKSLGVADVTLLTYEHGTANPTLDKVESLASQYGLQVTITGTPVPEQRTS